MKKLISGIGLLVLLISHIQVMAAPGFVALPTTGFSNSAYKSCYNDGKSASDPKGNFGSYSILAAPSVTTNNTCWVNKPPSELISPISGYSLVGSRTVSIPRTTSDSSVSIGTLVDYVWRDSLNNTCIIGTRITMSGNDHDAATPGVQYFQVNDIARGGFSGLSLNTAYTLFSSTSFPLFRVGRTFTSVQHRALRYSNSIDRQQDGINYLDLPTKNSVSTNISGEITPIGATSTASTTLASQDAVVNDNWVDFTLEVSTMDADGSASAVSPFTYIQAFCESNPIVKSGAVRLRQTAQENTTFKEIIVDGYAIGTP